MKTITREHVGAAAEKYRYSRNTNPFDDGDICLYATCLAGQIIVDLGGTPPADGLPLTACTGISLDDSALGLLQNLQAYADSGYLWGECPDGVEGAPEPWHAVIDAVLPRQRASSAALTLSVDARRT